MCKNSDAYSGYTPPSKEIMDKLKQIETDLKKIVDEVGYPDSDDIESALIYVSKVTGSFWK